MVKLRGCSRKRGVSHSGGRLSIYGRQRPPHGREWHADKLDTKFPFPAKSRPYQLAHRLLSSYGKPVSMQSVLRFDTPANKRRRHSRACKRCQRAKVRLGTTTSPLGHLLTTAVQKRCTILDEGHWDACERCLRDALPCSLAMDMSSPASLATEPPHFSLATWPTDATGFAESNSTAQHEDAQHEPARSPNASALPAVPVMASELRYSTMLHILQQSQHQHVEREDIASKLVGDTNPLSSLLRKDLKHRVRFNYQKRGLYAAQPAGHR